VGTITDPSQLIVEQETQRRLGDIFIGLQQAQGFSTMAQFKIRSHYHGKTSNTNGYTAYLELKTEEGKQKKDLEEFSPFMGGFGGGFGGGYGYPQQPQQPTLSKAQLQHASTSGKLSALKFFFVQMAATQSDVQLGYWMNKALSTILPQQFAVFKLYKNYLSTFAVASAIQLQDAFTLEAYLEDFNQQYGVWAGNSAELSEAIAERNVYSTWQQLVQMRLYLFYLSMYEQSMASMPAPAPVAPKVTPVPATPSSFLEVESEPAEPAKPQDPQSAMLMQYMYMYYYVRMIKFYTIFVEMSVPQVGLQMANFKVHGMTLLTDNDLANDVDGTKWKDHAEQMDGTIVPSTIAQWSQMVQMRYYFEYYLFMFDMYLPQLSIQRVMTRVDNAMLNTNFFQTAAQTTSAQ